MAVDEDIIELHAFAFQRIENKVVHRPEGVLREGSGTQAILVAHHHELVVRELADGAQRAEGAGHEYQLLEGINLLIGRFLDDGAVAVNEKGLFLHEIRIA